MDTQARRGIQFSQSGDRGLTVQNVERNSIFFNSGPRQGDIIVSLDGRPVRNEADFFRFAVVQRGNRVPVVVLRDGIRHTVFIEAPQALSRPGQSVDDRQLPAGGQAYLGVAFDPQIFDAAIVRAVTPGSPAEQADLQSGDVIVALNNQQVGSYRDAIEIIHSMRPGERLVISFERPLTTETEAVLGAQQGEPVHTATYESDQNEQRDAQTIVPQNRRIEGRGGENQRRILN